MYVKVKCNRCINGFVMTAHGPKACMFCQGCQYIAVEVPDDPQLKFKHDGYVNKISGRGTGFIDNKGNQVAPPISGVGVTYYRSSDDNNANDSNSVYDSSSSSSSWNRPGCMLFIAQTVAILCGLAILIF